MIPHNLVVVGSNADSPARFSTRLEPVKLKENVGIAIKSIFHGSINNISVENNKIPFTVNLASALGPDEWRNGELEIDVGNYNSTLAIIKSIALEFEKTFGRAAQSSRRKKPPRSITPKVPPTIEIDESEMDITGNGFIGIKPKAMHLIFKKDTPWYIFTKEDYVLRDGETLRIKNIDYHKTIQPTFLYSNIVESSYINGKLSRNLSTIPLSMNSGWNFHEFNNPVYVPIDVKEFTNIIIELRDMNGDYIKFDPGFKTIINLHIKPINTSETILQ